MAWLAAPTAHLLGPCVCRLVGAQLNPSNTATIGEDDDAGMDTNLPAAWRPFNETFPAGLSLLDYVRVHPQSGTIGQLFHIVKSLSPSGTFRVAITSDASNPITFTDIWVMYFHSLIR